MKDILPSKDFQFDTFQAFLVAQVIVNVAGWEIPNSEVTALGNAQLPWTQAWAVAKNKDNRTSADVQVKDDARAAYEVVLRPFIQRWIVLNELITDGERQAMGIKPRDTHHVPVPAPTTLPLVDALPEAGHRVKVFYRQQPDAQGVSKRGKPDGVKFCEVVYSCNAVPPNADACTLRVMTTRSPETIDFQEAQEGGKLYYFARWVNVNGKTGPWSDMQHCIIP